MSSISKAAAQRVSNAARALSEDEPQAFILALGNHLGLPINEKKLRALTVEDLNTLLSGQDGLLPENYDHVAMQAALRCLWGEPQNQQPAPEPESPPDSLTGAPYLQVAVASNNGE